MLPFFSVVVLWRGADHAEIAPGCDSVHRWPDARFDTDPPRKAAACHDATYAVFAASLRPLSPCVPVV